MDLLSLLHHVLVLDSHNSSSPVSSQALVVVELGSEVLAEVVQISIVFLLDLSQSKASSSLLVDELSESCFSLNNTEWNSSLSAESG